jgi:hypothetical protein
LVISDLLNGVDDWKGYTRGLEKEARGTHGREAKGVE